jgi:hypothetical protein
MVLELLLSFKELENVQQFRVLAIQISSVAVVFGCNPVR